MNAHKAFTHLLHRQRKLCAVFQGRIFVRNRQVDANTGPVGDIGLGRCRPLLQRVLHTALTPIINSLSVVGLISIPGMFTGQIISGTDPMVGAKYQILIMYAISTTTVAAVCAALLLATAELVDGHHCLRLDKLQETNVHAGTVVWCASCVRPESCYIPLRRDPLLSISYEIHDELWGGERNT